MNAKSRKQRLIAEINITPFTDVILVLLVIFMITTPLILQSSIKVNLPEAATAQPTKTPNQIEITITNEGSIYFVNKLVTRKELKGIVYDLQRRNPDLNVILRSDRLVRFKDIVGVLDILTEFGIKKLNIAATNE